MARPRPWFDRLLAEVTAPPFAAHVPSDVETFVASQSAGKLVRRRIRRSLWLLLNGQRGLERARIEPHQQRILWIHSGMPQVGDSLMDLACRVLMRGRRGRVDLLTSPHLVALYECDDVFAKVYSDASIVAGNEYDLVIVLGASAQNLREKLRWFRWLPFVSLHRFYIGPEFHRTLFNFFRLDELLGTGIDATTLEQMARPHMVVSDAVRQAVDALDLPPRFVAIALGGVRDWRTYDHWAEVLDAMDAAGLDVPVVLLGSANGAASRDALLARPRRRVVVDRVDRQSLPEAFEIVRRGVVLACADGGLMHLAHASGTATVALFAERIDPSYRLTSANRSIAFYAPARVSDIAPTLVAEAIGQALAQGIEGVTIRRV